MLTTARNITLSLAAAASLAGGLFTMTSSSAGALVWNPPKPTASNDLTAPTPTPPPPPVDDLTGPRPGPSRQVFHCGPNSSAPFTPCDASFKALCATLGGDYIPGDRSGTCDLPRFPPPPQRP